MAEAGDKHRVGTIRVNATDYGGRIVVERFDYFSTRPGPTWGVPAWDEQGQPDLAQLCRGSPLMSTTTGKQPQSGDGAKWTPGPWHAGHFADDTHSCQCTSIVSECYAGGICQMSIANDLPISEGGNDAPPLEQAKANARLISAAPTMAEYIRKRATLGDAEAVAIWESLNASR